MAEGRKENLCYCGELKSEVWYCGNERTEMD